MTDHNEPATAERLLRITALIFAAAVLVHGADHLRRGMDVLSQQVVWAGTLQMLFGLVTLVLVFRRHRWAPVAAIAIGFASATGFAAAHLLPHWGVFSDSYLHAAHAAHVTAFSWGTAIAEIAADLAFGLAGVYAVRHGRFGQAQQTSQRLPTALG